MKNIIILLLLAFYLNGFSQIINFPDPNFKNALVNTKCVSTNHIVGGVMDADFNDDGEIDVSEAMQVKTLIVSGNKISKFDGIANFKNLEILYCDGNRLISLNLEGLTNLKELNCNSNQITTLNTQGLINLNSLNCADNKLTNLDVQESKNLKFIFCDRNEIKTLNVQGLEKLSYLYCGENHIKALNVGGLPKLTNLWCIKNQMTLLNIQGSTNLSYLFCYDNELVSLDLNGLINLENLNCNNNKLKSLDLRWLTNLVTLNCSANLLTNLNVEGLTNLVTLNCSDNQLTNLNVEGLKNLAILYCTYNNLTNLNLSGLTNIVTLFCTGNLLTNLNVEGLTSLHDLYCNQNQLTQLNLTGLIHLGLLNCNENHLTFLNIKGVFISNYITFGGNPNLAYICCDEYIIMDVKNQAIINGQNCEVNSYCSFTPGGEFYTIRGINSYDENKNGCNDQDLKLPYFKYKITDGSTSGSIISNATGSHTIPVQAGTHTITPILENPNHFEVTPSSINVTFPSTSDTITQNFCITPKGILRQTNITVIPLSPPARPGFDASYKIVWENVGNQIESGTLNFTYDETLLDYISATQTADKVADGIIKWNFTNLLPFEKREITVTLKINRPTDTPAVNAGDKLYLTASILDNIFTLENTVVGSYDPNDKTCLQGDRVKPDMVGKYVDYLIRFENTGNYAAENVVIKDIIDTKTFDVSSLQITDASHEVYTRIEGNKVEFIFENIQLPFDDANNDGYVAFKIKTLPTLILGDSLKNLADIYFDYNFPIRTNEAQTTIALPSFTKDIATEVNVYPNPVRDILYLESNENWSKAEIYDISGRILRSVSLDGQSIDVSGLESGTYFMRLKDGEKVGVVKFVKM